VYSSGLKEGVWNIDLRQFMLLLNDDFTLLNTELNGKQLIKCTLEDWCVFIIKNPQILDISQACQCSAHEYIFTYILKFQMTPINVVLKKKNCLL
jgi:hypothetical protein